jgi:hypothetical protein
MVKVFFSSPSSLVVVLIFNIGKHAQIVWARSQSSLKIVRQCLFIMVIILAQNLCDILKLTSFFSFFRLASNCSLHSDWSWLTSISLWAAIALCFLIG